MRTRLAPLVVLAALAAASPAPTAAGAAPPAADGSRVEQLPGGPRLVLLPQRSVPMVSCTVFVPAGSALETAATNGAAHYLEHLLFNGTTTRTREEIYARTDLLGAYNNASTQQERTVFQLLLPSEVWREGFALQADMLLNSVIPEDMFVKERGIILEELAKDKSDADWAAGVFEAQALWGEDPRALPVLGTEESIAGMDRDAVAAFYAERYRPAGMTIVLMGDFDPDEARAEVAKTYGGRPEPAAPLPPRPPFPAGRTLVTKRMENLQSTRVRVVLPAPELSGDAFAGARILGGTLTSGEHAAVTRAAEAAGAAPLAASASVDGGSPWSALTVALDLPAETTDVRAVVDAVLAHLAAVDARGVDASDRLAARREFLSEELSLREKMHYYGLMRADVLGANPEAALRITERPEAAEKAAGELLRAALADGRVLVTAAGPALADGRTALGGAPAAAAAAWYADVKPGGVPALPPAPPVTTVTEVRRVVLEDGLTVIAHASPDARTFAAHILLKDRARHEAALELPRGAVDVVHRILGTRTAKRDADTMRGLLATYGASLKVTDADMIPYDDYYFSPEYSYVRLEGFDLFGLPALELAAEALYEPAWTEENLAQAKAAAAARAATDAASPRAAAAAAFYEALGAGHPLAGGVYGAADPLRALTLDDVRRLHAAITAPSNVIVAVSSSLPADVAIEAVRRMFSKRANPEGRPPRRAWTPASTTARVEVPVGKDQSWILVGAPLVVKEADRHALRLAGVVLSDRLAETLREKEGLAYSIGADVRLSDGACLVMGAGTRPANLERMEAGMKDLAMSLAARPPTPEELEGARNRSEGRDRMRRLSRMGCAYAYCMAELRGKDPAAIDADLPALRAVTPDDVARVAKTWFTPADAFVAIAR